MKADFQNKKESAEALIDELQERIAQVKGQRKAGKIADFLRLYRHLAGMREQPKFDLLRANLDVRNVIRLVGEELKGQGALESEDDVFFITIDDIRIRRSQLNSIARLNRAGWIPGHARDNRMVRKHTEKTPWIWFRTH